MINNNFNPIFQKHITTNSLSQTEEKTYREVMIQIENKKSSLCWFINKKGSIKELSKGYRLDIVKALANKKINLKNLDTFLAFIEDCGFTASEERGEIVKVLASKGNWAFTNELYKNFARLGILDETVRFEVAAGVAKSGVSHAMCNLTNHLFALHLSQENRTKLAEIFSNSSNKLESFAGPLYPIHFVINHIEKFELEEIDNARFAHEYLDTGEGWSTVAFKLNHIAPSNEKIRMKLAERFIQANSDHALLYLVINIIQFQLNQDFLKELVDIIIKRNRPESLTALCRKAEHFPLDKKKSLEIIHNILKNGEENTLAKLAGNIDKFQLSHDELPRIAGIIGDLGTNDALARLAENINKFKLSVHENLEVFTKIANNFSDENPSLALDNIIYALKDCEFPENSHEDEKYILASTLCEKCTDYNLGVFIKNFQHFKISIEANRKKLVELISRKFTVRNLKATVKNFKGFCSDFYIFKLSEKSTLKVLIALVERNVPGINYAICRNMGIFNVNGGSKFSLRVKLAFALLATHTGNWDQAVDELHIVNRDLAGADHSVPESANYVLRNIQYLGLKGDVLEILPELFPDEILNLFSEQISLVTRIIDKTKKESKELVGHQLVTLLVYLMQQVYMENISPGDIEDSNSLIKNLFKYKNPAMRTNLFLKMDNKLFGEKNVNTMMSWKNLSKVIIKELVHMHALRLIIYINRKPNDFDDVTEIIKLIQTDNRFIKDYKNREALLSFIDTAYNRSALNGSEMHDLLTIVYKIKNKNDRRTALTIIENMILCRKSEYLKEIKEPSDIERLFEKLFCEAFEVKNIEGFKEKYKKTFAQFRKSFALISYAGMIDQLNFSEKELVKTQYREYFLAVLNGRFQSMRYDKNRHVHLATIFGDREELEAQWIKGESISADDLTSPPQNNNNENDDLDLDTFFQEKIINHQHLGNNQLEKYPNLILGLQADLEARKELIEKISVQINGKKSELESTTEIDARNKIGQRLLILKFEKAVLRLSMKKLTQQELIDSLNKINMNPIKGTQLYNDIADLKAIQKKEVKQSTLTVVDTDDPNDLLLMGTEVSGSCQSIVEGIGEYNKCLVAYLNDGKNRMIAVKNSKGEIIGRCVLRMLWDGEKPVLFREEFYYSNHNSTVENLLEKMCLRRAKILGLTLLKNGKYDKRLKTYHHKVESLGSPAPLEYVDAETVSGEHIIKNGVFTLGNPVILYQQD